MPIGKNFTSPPGRWSLRRLLAWLRSTNPLRLVTLSAAALTMIAAGASIWWLYNLHRASTERELTNLSMMVSEHVARAMGTIDLILSQIGDRMLTVPMNEAPERLRLHLALSDMTRALAYIDSISVYDSEGRVIASSTGYPADGPRVADSEAFIALRNDASKSPYLSVIASGNDKWQRGITLNSALVKPGSGFSGMVMVRLDLREFADFFASIDLGPNTAVAMFRSDGELLLRSPIDARRMGADMSQSKIFTELLHGQDFGLDRMVSPIDGMERFVAAHRLQNTPIVMVLSVPTGAAMANWRDQALIVGFGAAFTVLLLLWLSQIAARQLAQRERRTRQALEAANEASRAKSSFLGVMSHELRTPLNAIIGFSDVIARETFGPLVNDKYLDYVKDINQSGRNLLVLINQILDLSRIEAGKHEMQIEELTLARVWQMIGNEMAVAAATRNIQLSLLQEGAKLTFAGELRATMQILSNLVSNAVKFTPEGGRITVSASEDAASGDLLLAVADTGRGIPPDRIVDVMKPFVQLADSYARETGGVGLGLSICKSLTETMGGRLRIESEVGVGTVVWVQLRRWVDRR